MASLSNGDIDEALDLARRLVARDPKNGLAHLVLGVGQMKDGHWVAARREFMSGGAGREHDVTATLLVGLGLCGAGRREEGARPRSTA